VPATDWERLSERLGILPVAGWHEDIPVALETPLKEWIHDTLRYGEPDTPGIPRPPQRFAGRPWWEVAVERLRLRLNVAADSDDPARDFAYRTAADRLADVVDAVLDLMSATAGRPRAELERLLDDARSALRLTADGRGLERRADVMAEAALATAAEAADAAPDAGSASAHLRIAWECVYSLQADPVKGYSEAIKAVEAAAHATLEPNNRMATLGTMRGQLRTNREKYALAIRGPEALGDVGPLLECMSLLWEGQASRHGSSRPTRPETLGEATMAVHLAVMLVQWFTSGAVRKR